MNKIDSQTNQIIMRADTGYRKGRRGWLGNLPRSLSARFFMEGETDENEGSL